VAGISGFTTDACPSLIETPLVVEKLTVWLPRSVGAVWPSLMSPDATSAARAWYLRMSPSTLEEAGSSASVACVGAVSSPPSTASVGAKRV
jgi:hypothetical protein